MSLWNTDLKMDLFLLQEIACNICSIPVDVRSYEMRNTNTSATMC